MLVVIGVIVVLGVILTLVMFCVPKRVSNDVIWASLTTTPERLVSDYFRRVVERVLRQNIIDVLLLNVPHMYARTREPYVIPNWVLQHPRIKTHRCKDIGPATKILGGLDVLPDHALVVVLDDDILYQDFMLEGLLQAHRRDPSAVSCWFANKEPAWVSKGWDFWLPNGFAGWIASADVVKRLHTLPTPTPECRFIDDHWLGWAFHSLGVDVVPIQTDQWFASVVSIHEHPPWHELRLHTNRALLQSQCLYSLREENFSRVQSRAVETQ